MKKKEINLLLIGIGVFTLLFIFNAGYSSQRKIPTILVCPKTLASSFWLTVRAGAYAAGKEFGAKIIWKGPAVETDIAGQIAIIEDYRNKKVDAIALAACDIKALIAPVKKAINASIPVVSFDSGLDPDPTLSLIATDNLLGGKQAGEVLVRLIGGKGQVACIPYISGASTSMLREKGFKEVIAKYPDIKLVAIQYSESDVAKAMAVTENILTANPNLSGIFAGNEPGAIGAAQAIRARGLAGKVKLVAFDASPVEIEMLQNGTIQALIVQNPYNMGYLAVKACVDAFNGRKVPKRIDTGVTVVSMDNFFEPQIQKILYPLANN
ncbi:MAG: substrate-binding domain-containing protein [Bacteroidota bacterium]